MSPIPEGDILIHAGDMTLDGKKREIVAFAEWFSQHPHPHKVAIAGNHDWGFQKDRAASERILEKAGILYLRDSGEKIGGLNFWGSPWQPWFYDWAFNLPRGFIIRKKWDLIPEGTDVLITHGPPANILDECPEPVGCEDLREVLGRVKPKLHVFGHIHEGYGFLEHLGTLYVNASTCDGEYQPNNPPVVVNANSWEIVR